MAAVVVVVVDDEEQRLLLQPWLVKPLAIKVTRVLGKRLEIFTTWQATKTQWQQETHSLLSEDLLGLCRAMDPPREAASAISMGVRVMWANFKHSILPLVVCLIISRITQGLSLLGVLSTNSRPPANSNSSKYSS